MSEKVADFNTVARAQLAPRLQGYLVISARAGEGDGERIVYDRLLGGDLAGRRGTARGFQPAMARAHSRASALSSTPGNNRRNSTAAENSPHCS
jgi:hypothetical protein